MCCDGFLPSSAPLHTTPLHHPAIQPVSIFKFNGFFPYGEIYPFTFYRRFYCCSCRCRWFWRSSSSCSDIYSLTPAIELWLLPLCQKHLLPTRILLVIDWQQLHDSIYRLLYSCYSRSTIIFNVIVCICIVTFCFSMVLHYPILSSISLQYECKE